MACEERVQERTDGRKEKQDIVEREAMELCLVVIVGRGNLHFEGMTG